MCPKNDDDEVGDAKKTKEDRNSVGQKMKKAPLTVRYAEMV